VEKYEQGYDIVYGERVDRDESKAMKRARKILLRLLRAVADEEILLDMAEFSLFTRKFATRFSMRTRLSPSCVLRFSLESDSGARLFLSNDRNALPEAPTTTS